MSGIEIKSITPNLMEDVHQFLREHFYPKEPCASALDLCPLGYRVPALEDHSRRILAKGFSLGAFHHDTGSLLGVLVLDMKVHCKAESDRAPSVKDGYPTKLLKLYRFFDDLTTNYGRSDFFRDLTYYDKIFDIYMLCTSAEFGGQGIGMQLMTEAVKIAERQGAKLVTCMALSLFTQKVATKLVFEEVSRIVYQDYNQDGDFIFSKANMGVHTSGVFYIKTFE